MDSKTKEKSTVNISLKIKDSLNARMLRNDVICSKVLSRVSRVLSMVCFVLI